MTPGAGPVVETEAEALALLHRGHKAIAAARAGARLDVIMPHGGEARRLGPGILDGLARRGYLREAGRVVRGGVEAVGLELSVAGLAAAAIAEAGEAVRAWRDARANGARS